MVTRKKSSLSLQRKDLGQSVLEDIDIVVNESLLLEMLLLEDADYGEISTFSLVMLNTDIT